MLFIDKLFVSKFVFYVVMFELRVKNLPYYLLRQLLIHIGHLTLLHLQNNPQGVWMCAIAKNMVTCKMCVSVCGLRGSANV